jgi:gamma-glutamyl phosphate reductase
MTIKQAENIWVTNNLNRNNYGTNKFSISALAAILSALFYGITKEYFAIFISIQIVNGIITLINYINKFGFDFTE